MILPPPPSSMLILREGMSPPSSKDQQRLAKIGKDQQRCGKYRKHTFKWSKDCPVRFSAYYTIGTKADEAIFAQILEF